MSWLRGPILALDLESTGTDPETARIVQQCIGFSVQPGSWDASTLLVNPGVPIPAEATRVHGIDDARVAAEGVDPADAMRSARLALCGAIAHGHPVVGHNVTYDLTLLDREMRRHIGDGLPEGLLVLDTLVLFRRFDFSTGGRALGDLARRHGLTLDAHDAGEDALTSMRLLHIICAANDLLERVPLPALMERQAAWYEAQVLAAEMRRRGNGHAPSVPDVAWPLKPLAADAEVAA